ncbi:MAG: hypothetical protein LC623_08745, partial [Halobacteriales archaeon]|nr:hypothetical protein [Halobacteriales archaeon]
MAVVCAALLLPAVGVRAAQAYAVVLESGLGTAPANQAVGVAVAGAVADLGPSVIQNGGFGQGMPPWQRSNPLGLRGVASVDGATALLRADQPAAAGTISLFEQLQF